MLVSKSLRRRACALLLGGLAAFAAQAGDAVRDETTIVVRTTSGLVEKVTFEGELVDRETRALTTAKGNPAVLSRNGAGMVLEVAGESFDIPTPSAELVADELAGADGAPADGRRMIVKHIDEDVTADGTGSETRKVVKVQRLDHDGATDADLLLVDPMDPELALEAAGEGKRVIVMRKLVHANTDAAPVQ
jgi:hypothetical protein